MSNRAREIAIFGCGGHAVSVSEVLLDSNPSTRITFVDSNASPSERIFGFDIVPEMEPESISEYFVALGANEARDRKTEELKKSLGHAALLTVIARDADIRRGVEIADGSFIGHQAHIGPLAVIGESSIVNTRAIVEHEVNVGSGSQIAPGAVIGGRTQIGENSFFGLRSVVLDRLSICSDVTVGASATVVKDIEEPGTYVGTPARRIA